jgi:Protein of unknown function (DUF3575)
MHTPFKKTADTYLKFACLLAFTFLIAVSAHAQEVDSTKKMIQESNLKNTVKVNVSSWILYSSGIQMGYERVLSPKRTFTVFGGIIQFPMPSLIANSSLRFEQNKEKSGYVFGAEYRFYLAKENKYAAPHGIYLAPFVSYYHFNNMRGGRDTVTQDALKLSTTLGFFNLGVELGYQFVIKKRFVIDCVLFGPALTSYDFNVKLEGSNGGNYNEEVQAILDALKNKYPLLKDLSSSEGVNKSGIANFWSLGFRYCIQIGYRF